MVLEVFAYGFMQRAVMAGILIALACSAVGTFLVIKKLSLIGDVLSHSAFSGFALGLFFKVFPFAVGLLFTILMAVGVTRVKKSTRFSGDAVMALFLTFGLGLAVVLLSASGGFNIDILSILFGSILLVGEIDLLLSAGISILVLLVIGLLYKEFSYLAFDEEQAQISGLSVDRLNLVLMILTGVTIVAGIRVIGVLLVTALIVVPNLISFQLSRGLKMATYTSMIVAVAAVIVGIFLSVLFNLASGGVIVITLVATFFLVSLSKGVRKGTVFRGKAFP